MKSARSRIAIPGRACPPSRRSFLRAAGLGAAALAAWAVAAWMLLAAAWCAGEETGATAWPNAKSPLGINLSGIADWGTERVFKDLFKHARHWVSHQEGTGWGKGPALELDENGWVKRLEPACSAEAIVSCRSDGLGRPRGPYLVLYEGEGKLRVNGPRVVKEEPGRIEVQLDDLKGFFSIQVRETNPAHYVRNLRVIRPDDEKTYRDDPFEPTFARRYERFAVYRFMDWARTNGSEIQEWADRPRPETATMSTKGVALEWMIQLCNQTHTHPWFCLPHRASDDFVRRFAQRVRERLDPELKVYLEYSNEVWNGIFVQSRHAQEKGQELGLGPKERPWEGGGMYYARRSVEIFRIWEEVFGGRERLVRVLAWQLNPWWFQHILLPAGDAAEHADALAVAPYFGGPFGSPKTAGEVAGWSLDKLLDECAAHQKKNHEQVRQLVEIAKTHGLAVLAYEGGQHLVGHGGAENHEKLTALFHAANRHPRMRELYLADLAGWKAAGGQLFCAFAGMGSYSKWGCWGILEHEGQQPTGVPKFRALLEFIEANPRWW